MIDLRSDTVTRPSAAMRDAARDAEVGDAVHDDDPTLTELERRAADRVGTEAALFVPSGTMGNQIAARVHADRGSEVLLDEVAHLFSWEVGGLAQLAGLQTRPLDFGDRAAPTPEQVAAACTEPDLHAPGTGLLAMENTHNRRGGVAVPPDRIDAAAAAAHERGVPVHLDGARLFNACVARDVAPERMVENVDSVMFALSKGLGAPIGSILAGSSEFIAAGRRERKLLGGGMRQVGLVAAPALIALDNVDRLADDHERADRLAAGVDDVDGLSAPDPETNIVMVDTSGLGVPAEEFVAALEKRGVAGSAFGDYRVRFCTHLDVDDEDVATAVERVRGTARDAGSA
ncbi:MAG: low specificity L-threonine aldolase [Haloferacaceae archaeon]